MPPRPFSREEILAAPLRPGCLEIGVRLQDVDAAGVVFFARILEYCHDALMATLGDAGLDLAARLREGRHLAPIRRVEADYLAPLRFGDRVSVGPVLARLEESQALVAHRVERPGGDPVAMVQTLHVSVDAVRFARSPFPEEWIAAFRRLGA